MMFGGYMGGGGLVWWFIISALVIIPFVKILPRNGIPAWVAFFAVIPLFAVILLWVVAFKEHLETPGDKS